MIDQIKELYSRLDKKTEFISKMADRVNKSPLTLRQWWFGQFWSIPEEYQQEVVDFLNETLKNQEEAV